MKDTMISSLSPDRQFRGKSQHFLQYFFVGWQSIIIYGPGQILIIRPQCVSSKCFPTGLSLSQPPPLIVPTIIIIISEISELSSSFIISSPSTWLLLFVFAQIFSSTNFFFSSEICISLPSSLVQMWKCGLVRWCKLVESSKIPK